MNSNRIETKGSIPVGTCTFLSYAALHPRFAVGFDSRRSANAKRLAKRRASDGETHKRLEFLKLGLCFLPLTRWGGVCSVSKYHKSILRAILRRCSCREEKMIFRLDITKKIWFEHKQALKLRSTKPSWVYNKSYSRVVRKADCP